MDDLDEIKQWLTTNGNAYCAELTSHIFIDANGEVRPCCDGTQIINDGTVFTLDNRSLNDVAHDPIYYRLIDEMNAGIIPDSCKICRDKEDILSPRISNSIAPRNIEVTRAAMRGDTTTRTINSVHVRAGNTCNLKCRICYYGLSSTWAKDAYKLIATDAPYKDTHIYDTVLDGRWPLEQTSWLDTTGLENIVSLHLSGGEPLMNDVTYQFTDKVLRVNNNIEVKFNTNGTFKYKEEYLDILLTAKEINFFVSIDDIGPRFEYQRSGALWADTLEVLEWFIELEKQHDNVNVAADITVSIFNVYYLPEILEEFSRIGLKVRIIESTPYDHYTRHNAEFYIRNLKDNQKRAIINKLRRYSNYNMIKDVIEHMSVKGTDYSNDHRLHMIERVDLIREERFADTFTEMYTILNMDT